MLRAAELFFRPQRVTVHDGGLDANGRKIGEAVGTSIVGLFRLTFRNTAIAMDRMAGEADYLFLATTSDKILRMKPQNLLTGLPLRRLETLT